MQCGSICELESPLGSLLNSSCKSPFTGQWGDSATGIDQVPWNRFLDFESTRTGLRLHLFILSASITSIVEHFCEKGAARDRNYEVIRRWSGGILGGDREVIGGDQRWSAIWVPFCCMAGTAFQLFEEHEKVGEQTPKDELMTKRLHV